MASGNPLLKEVVILGAGISGLTTALLLARKGSYNITVVAKHMPGDYDAEYASPWAGASYAPVSSSNTREAEWDRRTWIELEALTKSMPEAGIHFQENQIYVRDADKETAVGDWLKESMRPEGPWFRNTVPDYRVLDKASCPNGYDFGFSYTSVCINTGLYLPWLATQCLKHGVRFKRAIVQHIDDAFHMSAHTDGLGNDADVVVNCCGLGATTLGGVRDASMVPIRGQTVLVRNSTHGLMLELSGTEDSGDDELVYIMERAAGGGTILGGCYQKHNTNPNVDEELTQRILRRAAAACPALTGGKGPEALDVVQVRVGLRPGREGGTRVELQRLEDKHGRHSRAIVHNYGHGGFGYQCSWGCSAEVVALVEKALRGEQTS